jgi:hypothetical protein
MSKKWEGVPKKLRKKYLYLLECENFKNLGLFSYSTGKTYKGKGYIPQYKIGITNDINKRLEFYKKDYSLYELKVIGLWQSIGKVAGLIEEDIKTHILGSSEDAMKTYTKVNEWFHSPENWIGLDSQADVNEVLEFIDTYLIENKHKEGKSYWWYEKEPEICTLKKIQ